MIDPAVAERIKAGRDWPTLREHIEEEIAKIDKVSNFEDVPHDEIAIETLGRMRALEILHGILKPFDFLMDEHSDQQRHTRARHGLE